MRFITQKIHSLIDYPVAFSLIGMPFVLDLGAANPLARWLSVATGLAAFLLTVLTNHQTGIIKVIPYAVHLLVDRVVGITFLMAPFVLGFEGIDAIYYWANGAVVVVATFILNAQAENRAVRGQLQAAR